MGGKIINRINCFHCVHFLVTWDTKFPKACKAYGFKTAGMPSVTVFQSTGSDCIAFSIKQRIEERQIKNQKQRENVEKTIEKYSVGTE
jgi:hypothetical protein